MEQKIYREENVAFYFDFLECKPKCAWICVPSDEDEKNWTSEKFIQETPHFFSLSLSPPHNTCWSENFKRSIIPLRTCRIEEFSTKSTTLFAFDIYRLYNILLLPTALFSLDSCIRCHSTCILFYPIACHVTITLFQRAAATLFIHDGGHASNSNAEYSLRLTNASFLFSLPNLKWMM